MQQSGKARRLRKKNDMGVSYRAITIIGCEIDVTKLYEYTETYDAGHGCPAFQKMLKRGDRVEFCPTCGAELLKSGRRCKAPEYEEKDTLGGFEVVTAVDRTFLVAWSQQNGEDGSGGATRASTSGLFLSDARERVRATLVPLGMWNVASYGVDHPRREPLRTPTIQVVESRSLTLGRPAPTIPPS